MAIIVDLILYSKYTHTHSGVCVSVEKALNGLLIADSEGPGGRWRQPHAGRPGDPAVHGETSQRPEGGLQSPSQGTLFLHFREG